MEPFRRRHPSFYSSSPLWLLSSCVLVRPPSPAQPPEAQPAWTRSVARQVQQPARTCPACARRPAGGGRRPLLARPAPRPEDPAAAGTREGASSPAPLGAKARRHTPAARSDARYPPSLRRPAPAPPPIPERGAAPRGLLPRPPATPARPRRRRCRGSKGRAGRERAGRGASRKPAGQVGGKGRETHKLSASPGRWRQAGWPWTESHRGSEEPGPAARRGTSEGSLQGTAPRARPCPRGHVGQRALQPGECGPRAAAGRAQVRAAWGGGGARQATEALRAPSPAAPGAGGHLRCLLSSPSPSLRRP